MPEIYLQTSINAPINICFDLSRSIDLHLISTQKTGEKAIAGRTSGLIELNETVTWQAKHFGIWQKLSSKITAFHYPYSFEDQMISGAFKSFRHQHIFSVSHGQTLMEDIFTFESPLGILGQLANKLFLTKYMTALLTERNSVIKAYAESDKWKLILPNSISVNI